MNTVKCTNCGNENINTNIRCEKCGKQLIKNEDNINHLIQQDPVKEIKLDLIITIFRGIVTTIKGTIFSIISSMIVFKGANTVTKIFGIPFLICGIAVLIYGISMIIIGIIANRNTSDVNGKLDMNKVEKNEKNFLKMKILSHNIYMFGFLLFWFGFLIVFDVVAIKSWSDGGNQLFFLSIIFWIAGIYLLINNIKKNK